MLEGRGDIQLGELEWEGGTEQVGGRQEKMREKGFLGKGTASEMTQRQRSPWKSEHCSERHIGRLLKLNSVELLPVPWQMGLRWQYSIYKLSHEGEGRGKCPSSMLATPLIFRTIQWSSFLHFTDEETVPEQWLAQERTRLESGRISIQTQLCLGSPGPSSMPGWGRGPSLLLLASGAPFWADTESSSNQPWLVTLISFKKWLLSTLLAFSAWDASMPSFWMPLVVKEKAGKEPPRWGHSWNQQRRLCGCKRSPRWRLQWDHPILPTASSTSAPDILACKYFRSTPPNPDVLVSWTLYTLPEVTEVWEGKWSTHQAHMDQWPEILCACPGSGVLMFRDPEYQLPSTYWSTLPSSEVICKGIDVCFRFSDSEKFMNVEIIAQCPDAALFLFTSRLVELQSSFQVLHVP